MLQISNLVNKYKIMEILNKGIYEDQFQEIKILVHNY
jgi:hypothetical protein